MVCTADDLLGWKDFPKGLRVLLLDEDNSSAAEIRSKLEEMEYIVSSFYNENEALLAISNKSESFHVAIVEVNMNNSEGRLKFLQTATHVPTIMSSNVHCLSIMMKCIALGAVEFLSKPLSEDKLRNIWQHVVHKAFNAGAKDLSESLKPVKGSLVSVLQLQSGNGEPKNQTLAKAEHVTTPTPVKENSQDMSSASDKYPAPSTPQIKQGAWFLDDGDCQDQTNFSIEKESGERDVESKSVETSCDNAVAETTAQTSPPQRFGETIIKEENESAGDPKCQRNTSPHSQNKDSPTDSGGNAGIPNKPSVLHNSSGTKANRKKMKVDWTPELHKKFVQAVEQLGVDQAIPSRILELMKTEGLTRHNVASHLQKYRMQRRHILPKEDDRRWPHPRDSTRRSYYSHKPVMAFPPYSSNHTLPAGPIYPAWGQPGSNYLGGTQVWASPYYPAWQPTESWHWKPYPGLHADAWGCPVMPPPLGSCVSFPQSVSGYPSADTKQNSCSMPHISLDLHPAEEEIDKVVKEAISKPWLPLPLGLKPPSTDSVLSELSRQGISTIPLSHAQHLPQPRRRCLTPLGPTQTTWVRQTHDPREPRGPYAPITG